MALSKSDIGLSPVDRAQRLLAEREKQARARIAAAEVRPEAAISNRLHAARLYQSSAATHHADALKEYRAAQERLASAPETGSGIFGRRLGRQHVSNDMAALEQDVANARARLVVADRALGSATANLARVERDEQAARREYLDRMDAERRSGIEQLEEVVIARRISRAFPAIIYSGPLFSVWAGAKVARKRRKGLRNPNAKNMWGLPIDFG